MSDVPIFLNELYLILLLFFFWEGGVHVFINVLIVLFYFIHLFKTHAKDKIPCDIKTNITE